MSERMARELVGKALFNAVNAKRPPEVLIHHSGRGSQYCSHDYQSLLKQFGIQSSMSKKGNCYDNAPMESPWGTLKNELVHHQRYRTRQEAIQEIREYIEIFYNRQRRQKRPGYLFTDSFREKPLQRNQGSMTIVMVSTIDSAGQGLECAVEKPAIEANHIVNALISPHDHVVIPCRDRLCPCI